MYGTEDEDSGNTAENYEIILSSLGYHIDDLYRLQQQHTDTIITVDSHNHNDQKTEIGDALVTNEKNKLLSIRTADCVPILLYDARTEAIGAIHAGWRGTLSQIVYKTVQRMKDLYGTNPTDIQAAIGPAIGLCCYEVDEDFYERFYTEFGKKINAYFTKPGEKPHCDIITMNLSFLQDAGVQLSNIDISGQCTKCNPELFYSHRRSGNKRGSMAAFIGMK